MNPPDGQASRRTVDDGGIFDDFARLDAGDLPDPEAVLAQPRLAELLAITGEVRGRRVLDCGCGTGMTSCALAHAGAEVVGFDIAASALEAARESMSRLGLLPRTRFLCCDFANLPLDDASIDLALGTHILHHVPLPEALAELSRVMRPGGRAAFQENQLTSPLLRFAWLRLTGSRLVAKYSTEGEFPLVAADYEEMRRHFPVVRVHYPTFAMFSMANRNVFRFKPRWRLAMRLMEGIDGGLGRLIPSLRSHSYRCVVELQKPA